MAIVYRTTGVWGPGKGSNLTKAELDGNFYDIATRVLALEENPVDPNSIDTIEVEGGQMTITLTGGEIFGPFALPVAVFNLRGDWVALEDYFSLDLIAVPEGDDAGMYLVLIAHEAQTAFDPDYTIGGEPVYHLVVPPGPTGLTGATGAAGAAGAAGFFDIGAAGPLATRDDFNDEDEGFIFLSTDGDGDAETRGVLYIRGPAGPGDWEGPYLFQGPEGPAGFAPDATGLFADRADHDAEDEGFSYLSLDGEGNSGDPAFLFFRIGTAGWSDPISFTGPPGEDGINFDVDAVGTFEERSAYDAELEGFSFLSTDGDGITGGLTTGVIFIRVGTEGWSDAIPFQGPEGPQGEQGETGAAGANFNVDAFGTFEERSLHDAEDEGFSYLSIDGDGITGGETTGVIFIRVGATAGWSEAIPFQGPIGPIGPEGDIGPIGPTGPQGYNFDVDVVGVFADRAAYNAQPQGFAFLSTNGDGAANTAASIYVKMSNTSGDWSTRIPFQGPKGDPGATGATGATGPAGPAGAAGSNGVGVPTGGTTGQVLTKTSGSDFATSWQTPAVGGSAIEIQDEGEQVSDTAGAETIDFVGAGVTAHQRTDGVIEVNIPGGGGSGGPAEIVEITDNAELTNALHSGMFIKGNKATDFTLTIDAEADGAWDEYAEIAGVQFGAGKITFDVQTGTLRVPTLVEARTRGQNSMWTLKRLASNDWLLGGDLELS